MDIIHLDDFYVISFEILKPLPAFANFENHESEETNRKLWIIFNIHTILLNFIYFSLSIYIKISPSNLVISGIQA